MKSRFRFFTFIFIILLLPLSVFAQGWTLKEEGTMQSVHGIVQLGSTLIAVGNTGKVMYSKDEGQTWTLADQISSQWFYDIEVLSTGEAMAVGEGGIAITSSNGINWSPASIGTVVSLYGMDVEDGTGMIVGADGSLFYSSASNTRWSAATTNVTDPLYAVDVLSDTTTVYAVGKNGKLLRSINGGVSWITLSVGTSETLRGVRFLDAETGFIVGVNGTIRKTTNGTQSWTDVSIDGISTQTLYGIHALGSEIVIVGDKVVARSADSGETWAVTSFADERLTFYDAYFESDGSLWIAGTMDDVKSVVYAWEEVGEVEEGQEGEEGQEVEEDTEVEQGNLIKLSCGENADVNDPCRAVYYYATDSKRHAFPNEKVYFTWFEDFDDVIEVNSDFMALISLGSNVTYHPGVRMVKFQTVPTVYAVERGGMLRAIASESVALSLYGVDWNQKIDDIADVFYGNYTFGATIENANEYDVAVARNSVSSLNENF